MGEEWLNILEARVREKSLVVFQFEGEEWCRLRESRLGVHEFTVARPREVMSEVQALTACLIFGTDGHRAEAHFGLVSSRLAVSTLDSRFPGQSEACAAYSAVIQDSSPAACEGAAACGKSAKAARFRRNGHRVVV